MPFHTAPEGVSSISSHGREFTVEDGRIDTTDITSDMALALKVAGFKPEPEALKVEQAPLTDRLATAVRNTVEFARELTENDPARDEAPRHMSENELDQAQQRASEDAIDAGIASGTITPDAPKDDKHDATDTRSERQRLAERLREAGVQVDARAGLAWLRKEVARLG